MNASNAARCFVDALVLAFALAFALCAVEVYLLVALVRWLYRQWCLFTAPTAQVFVAGPAVAAHEAPCHAHPIPVATAIPEAKLLPTEARRVALPVIEAPTLLLSYTAPATKARKASPRKTRKASQSRQPVASETVSVAANAPSRPARTRKASDPPDSLPTSYTALQARCKARGIKATGTRAELEARLAS